MYAMSILETDSRAILASAVSRKQATPASRMVLYAALRHHGSPEAFVRDGGRVVASTQAKHMYDILGIRKARIEPKQRWQSYIETNCNVMRRMADGPSARATTWAEFVAVHAHWVGDVNDQDHGAHRERTDGCHRPAEVLGGTVGTMGDMQHLHRIFYPTRCGRTLNKLGSLRVRHGKISAEEGLAGQSVDRWLYMETLTVAYQDEPWSYDTVEYEPDADHLAGVNDPHLLESQYQSPQQAFWKVTDEEWLKALKLRPPLRRAKRVFPENVEQHSFLHLARISRDPCPVYPVCARGVQVGVKEVMSTFAITCAALSSRPCACVARSRVLSTRPSSASCWSAICAIASTISRTCASVIPVSTAGTAVLSRSGSTRSDGKTAESAWKPPGDRP